MYLQMAIKNFYRQKSLEDVSSKTMQNYKDVFNIFQEFCIRNEIIEITGVDKNIIKNFLWIFQF